MIRSTRLRRGVSVSELAERLGVTASAVSQMERSEEQGTIKLNTLRQALSGLDSNLRLTAGESNGMSLYAPFRVADTVADALQDKDPTYALRLLTHGAKELEDNFDEMDEAEIFLAPTTLADERWDTLLRATYAHAIPRGRQKPPWTRATRLPEAWFVSQYPILRERAKGATPEHLRRLNIFIDENSLRRA